MAEGLNQGAWQFTEMKKPADDKKPPLERMDVLAHDGPAELIQGHRIGRSDRGGPDLRPRHPGAARQRRARPAMSPSAPASWPSGTASASPCSTRRPSSRRRWGRCYAVAQGSAEEPRFIALEYKGRDGAPIVLVGKGVTFDTGGISIKPAQNMEDMKYDMSGAAAVLGTFEMLGRLKPKVHVVGLIPSTENMPSGTAVKPGDVVTSHLGKTIEIINTDAEGRLILADALSYARRYDPAAWWTSPRSPAPSSWRWATRRRASWGPTTKLVEEIRGAGERADERVWPLPLWDDYRDLMKSDIADVKNSGGRPAGSISAGWFLREFVDGFPWAHLDIAGTAYSDREDASRVKGPTGVGVRLFSEFVLAQKRKRER